MKTPPFNLEEVYDKQIAPLMTQIIDICKENKMPMIASFNYAHGMEEGDPDGDSFATTNIPGCPTNAKYHPDEFKEACKIIRGGASTRPKLIAMTITTQKP